MIFSVTTGEGLALRLPGVVVVEARRRSSGRNGRARISRSANFANSGSAAASTVAAFADRPADVEAGEIGASRNGPIGDAERHRQHFVDRPTGIAPRPSASRSPARWRWNSMRLPTKPRRTRRRPARRSCRSSLRRCIDGGDDGSLEVFACRARFPAAASRSRARRSAGQ